MGGLGSGTTSFPFPLGQCPGMEISRYLVSSVAFISDISGDAWPDKWLIGSLTHVLTYMTGQEAWHVTHYLADTWSDPCPTTWPNMWTLGHRSWNPANPTAWSRLVTSTPWSLIQGRGGQVGYPRGKTVPPCEDEAHQVPLGGWTVLRICAPTPQIHTH